MNAPKSMGLTKLGFLLLLLAGAANGSDKKTIQTFKELMNPNTTGNVWVEGVIQNAGVPVGDEHESRIEYSTVLKGYPHPNTYQTVDTWIYFATFDFHFKTHFVYHEGARHWYGKIPLYQLRFKDNKSVGLIDVKNVQFPHNGHTYTRAVMVFPTYKAYLGHRVQMKIKKSNWRRLPFETLTTYGDVEIKEIKSLGVEHEVQNPKHPGKADLPYLNPVQLAKVYEEFEDEIEPLYAPVADEDFRKQMGSKKGKDGIAVWGLPEVKLYNRVRFSDRTKAWKKAEFNEKMAALAKRQRDKDQRKLGYYSRPTPVGTSRSEGVYVPSENKWYKSGQAPKGKQAYFRVRTKDRKISWLPAEE